MEKYVKPYITNEEMKIYKSINKRPVRKLPKSQDSFYKKNPIIFSLTSSPTRLRKIGAMLTLILKFKYCGEIHINLPELYRNKEEYNEKDIQFISKLSPKIKIFRVKQDIGPLTKILPTIERFMYCDPERLIISVDDDIGYSIALLTELIYYSYRYPRCIFTGSGFGTELEEMDFKIPKKYFPSKYSTKRIPGADETDIVEGWGGIAYRPIFFNIDLLLKLNSATLDCKLSDDLTISFMLMTMKIRRYRFYNKYHENEDIYSFDYGFGLDALHKGGGLANEEHNANYKKYMRCAPSLMKIYKNY